MQRATVPQSVITAPAQISQSKGGCSLVDTISGFLEETLSRMNSSHDDKLQKIIAGRDKTRQKYSNQNYQSYKSVTGLQLIYTKMVTVSALAVNGV